MSTEFNELLPAQHGDKTWIWIFGDRDQVIHTMNEFYVKRIATDRIHFTPIIPAPFEGKFMTILIR
jgi:hypothetical protein